MTGNKDMYKGKETSSDNSEKHNGEKDYELSIYLFKVGPKGTEELAPDEIQ